ncbi:MAG: glycosyltransferase [Magnetococcales bacterium]|nr:glycosyltransferase [Magnetococcales bacterium]
MQRLIIIKDGSSDWRSEEKPGADEPHVISFDQLKSWIKTGHIIRHLFRYGEVSLRCYRTYLLTGRFMHGLFMRLLSRGKATVHGDDGETISVTWRHVLSWGVARWRDSRQHNTVFSSTMIALKRLEAGITHRQAFNRQATPVYLRMDFFFGVQSGGSLGHIAGVLNHLDTFCHEPIMLTTDRIPTVRPDLQQTIVPPKTRFLDFREIRELHHNTTAHAAGLKLVAGREISFVYQRYAFNSTTAVALSQDLCVPLVTEYNGSEVWIAKNWGDELRYETLSRRIESLNLTAADLVVVVSKPLRDELVAAGIDARRILVNPNGVNPDVYHPDVDGSIVRQRYDLLGKQVIGFIGTFGLWHGADVLVQAFDALLQRNPDLKENVRLLLIGNGITFPTVQEEIRKRALDPYCVTTGLVAQKEGPSHLAACDILASPHVPNPDGTPFFGSPTKLFEYMAMGRPIVASNLDQIGEILSHEKTAYMVDPGDPDSLAAGLEQVLQDKTLQQQLATRARDAAVDNHTWKRHTEEIITALERVTRLTDGSGGLA